MARHPSETNRPLRGEAQWQQFSVLRIDRFPVLRENGRDASGENTKCSEGAYRAAFAHAATSESLGAIA
jgi:hypothetical protein